MNSFVSLKCSTCYPCPLVQDEIESHRAKTTGFSVKAKRTRRTALLVKVCIGIKSKLFRVHVHDRRAKLSSRKCSLSPVTPGLCGKRHLSAHAESHACSICPFHVKSCSLRWSNPACGRDHCGDCASQTLGCRAEDEPGPERYQRLAPSCLSYASYSPKLSPAWSGQVELVAL